MQLFFNAQQLLRFFFLDGSDGYARPARDHVFNVLAAHYAGGRFIQMIFFPQRPQVLPLFALLVGVKARLLELVIGDGVFHAVHDELYPLLHLGDLIGQRRLPQFHARACFVDQIDGFVRQIPVRDVAIGVRHREVHRLLRVGDRVEFFVTVLDALDHFHRFHFVWRRNFYRLETPLQRPVFLDGFAIFPRRGGANALDLAARKRRLQNVGRVQRPFRRARAHQGVQLVDENDGILVFHQLFHDGLEPLFELPAIFRARNDERKVQRQDPFFREERRHFALGDALR